MKRRFPALVLAVAALAAVIATTRTTVPAATATFSVSAQGWMPSVTDRAGITQTWFCPGVPATGGDVQGEVLVANRSDTRLRGTVVVINDDPATTRLDLDVPAWGTQVVDLDATLPSAMVGAIVEVEGGGAVVEQVARAESGDSTATCATSTSDTWYLADGFTVDGSKDQIVLTNPYEQTVVADLRFSTREGSRAPARYSGLTVAPRSVRVIDLGAPGAGAQSEPLLAVTVEVSQGRLVVGRSQTFLGGGRLGTQVTLAQPALRDQWWFAGSRVGAGVAETYSIYNPTDDDVDVDVVFLGTPALVETDSIPVPARSVVQFDPTTVDGLDEGSYAAVFATLSAPSIVVDRVTTSTIDGVVATTVIAGATARPGDGLIPSAWHVTRAPAEPTAGALTIHNADNADGAVTVYAVGVSGPVPVPGLENLTLPAARQLTIDLTDEVVLGRQLIVETSNRVFVSTAFPTGRGDTRVAAWAVPEG